MYRCQHCKALEPEWTKAADLLANSPVRVAKIDATENEDLAKEFNVQGYPAIRYFKNGKPSDYTGGRTAAEIATWAFKKIEPKSFLLRTETDLTDFQKQHEVFALGVFHSMDSPACKAFQSLADDDEAHVYAFTTDEGIKSKLFYPRNVGEKEFVLVLKNFEELRADMAIVGKFSTEKVSNFVKFQSTPPVQEFSAATMKRIQQSPIKLHVLFFTDKEADHHAASMELYHEVSVEYRKRLLFINVPATETKVLEFFNISTAQLPTMVLRDFADEKVGMKRYPYDSGAVEVGAISAFIASVLEGKRSPAESPATISPVGSGPANTDNNNNNKSEEVSPEDTAGDVTVLKGTSFAELVLNNDKDVLVEFYAPWCGHCKKLGEWCLYCVWCELVCGECIS